MNDTPKHIKDLQIKIWLSNTPGERLLQFIKDNQIMFRSWKQAKEEREKEEKTARKDLTG
jgi:cytidylate kinase